MMEDDKVKEGSAEAPQLPTAGEQAELLNILTKSHEDPKKAKSVFVDDDSWSKDLIPCLSTLCLENIVQNFEGVLLFLPITPHCMSGV